MNSYYQYNSYRSGGNKSNRFYKKYNDDYNQNEDFNSNEFDNFPNTSTNKSKNMIKDFHFNNYDKNNFKFVQYNDQNQYNNEYNNTYRHRKNIKGNKKNNSRYNYDDNNSDFDDVTTYQDNLKLQNENKNIINHNHKYSNTPTNNPDKRPLSEILIDKYYEKDLQTSDNNKIFTTKIVELNDCNFKDEDNTIDIKSENVCQFPNHNIEENKDKIEVDCNKNQNNSNFNNDYNYENEHNNLANNFNEMTKNGDKEFEEELKLNQKVKKLSDFFSPNYKENLNILNKKLETDIEENNEVNLNSLMINFNNNVEIYNRMRYNSMFIIHDNNSLFNMQNFYSNLKEEEIITYNELNLTNKSTEDNIHRYRSFGSSSIVGNEEIGLKSCDDKNIKNNENILSYYNEKSEFVNENNEEINLDDYYLSNKYDNDNNNKSDNIVDFENRRTIVLKEINKLLKLNKDKNFPCDQYELLTNYKSNDNDENITNLIIDNFTNTVETVNLNIVRLLKFYSRNL